MDNQSLELTTVEIDVETETHLQRLRPATVPPHVHECWIVQMGVAYSEGVESTLSLQAGEELVSDFTIKKWARAMGKAAEEVRQNKANIPASRFVVHSPPSSALKATPASRIGWLAWASSAAAVVAVLGGAIVFMQNYEASSGVPAPLAQRDIQRSAVNVVEKDVQWNQELGMAVRKYEVDVEDSLDMKADGGENIRVTVPHKTQVEVPEIVY